MASAWDVRFGRLAIQHGLVSPEAVRHAYEQLPPGRALHDELVARGQLDAAQAARLVAWLQADAAASGRLARPAEPPPAPPSAPPDDDATIATPAAARPAPPAPAADDDTVAAPRASDGAAGSRLPEVGQVIGGLALEALLGKGGMGAVFRARAQGGGDPVALKVLLPGADPGGAALARFRREAEALAKVDAHAGIVRVRALGAHQGLPYAVMDLVEGRDLRRLVKDEGALAPERALRYTEAVARAVHHCHVKGVLHRDLKPANVLLRERDDAPLVMDFGLALDHDAERLTRTGEVMGTPAYMPPEQADGDRARVDARSDVYALGAILFELVTGRPPFQGQPLEVLKQVFLDLPPPVRSLAPRAPDDVDVIVRKAMAKDPALRYGSAAALADDLARLRRGEPIQARPPTRWQELRWRWRQRDRRLVVRVAVALALVLGAPLAFVARQEHRRKQLVASLAGAVAALDPALGRDAWPVLDEQPRELLPLAEAIRSSGAALDGRDDDHAGADAGAGAGVGVDDPGARTPLAAAALDLADRLTRDDDGLARALVDALPAGSDATTAREALARLARRAAFDAHGPPGEGPCPAEHTRPCWDPRLALPPDGPRDPEARLLGALRALRRGQEAPTAVTLAQATAARATLVELAADRSRAPGRIAASVEETLSALRAEIDARLARSADGLVEAMVAALETGREVKPPAAWGAADQVGDRRAAASLPACLADAKLEAAERLLAELSARLPGAGALWLERSTYVALKQAIDLVLDLVLPTRGALPTQALVDRLSEGVSRVVYAAGARARESGLSANEGDAFPAFVASTLHFLTEVEGASSADAADCLAFGTFAQREGQAAHTAMMAVAGLRFGLPFRVDGLDAADLARILGELEGLAATLQLPEPFLARALVRLKTRHHDNRSSLPNVEEVLLAFAAAAGDALDPALRARQGLPPAPPLLAPLERSWRAYVLGGVAVYGVRRERLRARAAGEAPRRDLVEAWLAVVDALPADALPGNEHAQLLDDVAEEVQDLRELLVDLGRDPEWAAELERDELRRLERAMEAAWSCVERGVQERRRAEGAERPGLAMARGALDPERDARKGYLSPVSDLARAHARRGDAAAARALLTRADEQVLRLGIVPPADLLLMRANLELGGGDPAAAATTARTLVERLERWSSTLVDRRDLEGARRDRGRARWFLVQALQAQGDEAGARAAREAARAAGDVEVEPELWSR